MQLAPQTLISTYKNNIYFLMNYRPCIEIIKYLNQKLEISLPFKKKKKKKERKKVINIFLGT